MPDDAARSVSRLAVLALALAVLAAFGALVSGPGYRVNFWTLSTGFSILRDAAFAAIAASVLGVVAAIVTRHGRPRRGFGLALAALVIGIGTFAWPAVMLVRARSVPVIHDITTDTVDPPRFVVALDARAGASNPATYGGPEVASQQRAAYPDIVPFDSPLAPAALFDKALATARAMGWRILSGDPDQGRIEASDSTLFFGFTDDVVIRIVARGNGSRLDIRSVSRIGTGDVGTNARRIRRFLERVRSG